MSAWPHVPFDLQGHRGARGLAPESTIASFDAAIAHGVTGIEFDVRLTGDGEVVVWHDPTLEAAKCVFQGEDLAELFDRYAAAHPRCGGPSRSRSTRPTRARWRREKS